LKKLAERIQSVGLIGNADKPACTRVVAAAARQVAAAGRSVVTDAATHQFSGFPAHVVHDARAVADAVDLVLVFGGDGTMLRVAREIAGSRTPMLGINLGNLGFLTAVPSRQLASALKRVWQGQFKFESRTLIEAKARNGAKAIHCRALNDIVISHGIESRLIELEVSVDGEPVTCYRGDGLIISSPTGSTAYSLAAGGAVVFPTAEVFAVTPICPHTLSNRSLILDLSSTITVKVLTSKPAAVLSADGQIVSELPAGAAFTLRRSRHTVRLMHLAGSSFFEALRQKLHWRGTNL
jgi:NAD+ kinase